MILKISILLISYLLGSIPTGFLCGKYLKNIDLREKGSGSTGATNVLRNVGKWPALFVFIIDVLKGFISVKIAYILTQNNYFEVLAGLLSISGHIWPIWLKGKGGKAVATGLGMFLALSLEVGFASLGVFLLILSKFKIVSLASICAAISLPILMYFYLSSFNHPFTMMSLIVSLLVIWKHRTNINRLLKGVEPRINNKN
tara:strand:- start:23552 stop:24151 length:600 start_codon:yes stop_codon:yes gene_type:complete